MDGSRFDALTRALAASRSRRSIVKGLIGGALGSMFAVNRSAEISIAAAPPCRPAPPDGRPTLTTPWPSDVHPVITTGYGGSDTHSDRFCKAYYAVDFAVPGTKKSKWTSPEFPVLAAMDGFLYRKDDSTRAVTLYIYNGVWQTQYMHLSHTGLINNVTEQDAPFWVTAGTPIGIADSTGTKTSGNHLHFALYGGQAPPVCAGSPCDGCINWSYPIPELPYPGLAATITECPPTITKPKITGTPVAHLGPTSATINWDTNVNADSRVEYGLTRAYGQVDGDATLTRTHGVVLSPLQQGTTYHYRVRSFNDAGEVVSKDYRFTTTTCPSGTTPCGADCVALGTAENCLACGDACDDGNSCTLDACIAGSGCSHTPLNGVVCRVGGVDGICVVGRCTTGSEYRVVLTWGAAPSDLDSHLWLPSATPYHVFFSDRGTTEVFPFAELDHDDTSSFGPETITIAHLLDGVYAYAVYNYSGESALALSGAQVQLYSGGTLLRTYAVPQGSNERWWDVFRLASDGTITDVNQLLSLGASPGPYDAFTGTAQANTDDGAVSGAVVEGSKGAPGPDVETDATLAPVIETPTEAPATGTPSELVDQDTPTVPPPMNTPTGIPFQATPSDATGQTVDE
jgi:murein DD-endopeptidase MepM/ murein hydrolase activator NlpD